MDNNTSQSSSMCFQWMKETLERPGVTLQEINDKLIIRNAGGIALLILLTVIGVIGNTHVLFIYHRKFRKSNYRIYVLWLALLDVVNCCLSAPLVVMYLLFPLTFPSAAFCKFFRFVLYFFSIVSTSSLVVIAVDRCRKILKPLGSQINIFQAKLMCGITVIVSLVLAWPAPVLFGLRKEPTGVPGLTGVRCLTDDAVKNPMYMVIFSSIHTVFYIVVSTSLIIVYVLIGRQVSIHNTFRSSVRRESALSYDESKGGAQGGSINAARRTTLTLFAVTLAYIISALPHHSLALLYFLSRDLDCQMTLIEAQLYYTFIWSYFVNSAVNPFIYGYRDKKFRKEVKMIYSKE